MKDTIAAIATATGVGGVGIVRVSGSRALEIAKAVTGRDRWDDRRLVHVVVSADGRRIDDGLGVWMRGPASFTGEDVVELQVHGGAVNLGQVLGAVVAAGARVAEPGEFTRRALEAGKIGVLEAEAMLAVVSAESERGWQMAQRQLGGELAARVAGLRRDAAALLAEVEADIDFPEEDLDPAAVEDLAGRARGLGHACAQLAASFAAGRAFAEGLTVALVGRVNAGKSSLLNALVGGERALVSDEPGTTRDVVEARVKWRGVTVTLIDTAGEREAGGELEQRGVALGQRRAAEAHVVIAVVGPDDPPGARPSGPSGDSRVIFVASKSDLGGAVPAGYLPTSAVTGAGIEALIAAVLAKVGVIDDVEAGGAVVLTERQRAAASRATTGFSTAAEALAYRRPMELVALDLRGGLEALAALAGDHVGEEVLDALFARFCIGK